MPDENKLAKLREIHFVTVDCCNMCTHGQFRPGSDFGVCQKFTYEHQKHTGKPRQLSIHRAGRCLHFEPAEAKVEEVRRSGFLSL